MSNYGELTRTIIEDDTLLVCGECGSKSVQIDAFVDANTHEYVGDLGNDPYCTDCGDSTTLITRKEWNEKQAQGDEQ